MSEFLNPEMLYGMWQPVARKGYRWIEAQLRFGKGKEFILAAKDHFDNGTHYNPLSKKFPNLYRKFASLPEDQESILRFADEYGMLGNGDLLTQDSVDKFDSGYGESERSWFVEIRKMKAQVTLWDRLTEREKRQFPQMKEILTVIDDSLFNKRTVCPRPLWDKGKARPYLLIVPNSLLGALWLQFAKEVCGEITRSACFVCGKDIPLSRDTDAGFRADKGTCSNACRKRLSRRKTQALKMHSEGIGAQKISKILNLPFGKISDWFGKERKTKHRSASARIKK